MSEFELGWNLGRMAVPVEAPKAETAQTAESPKCGYRNVDVPGLVCERAYCLPNSVTVPHEGRDSKGQTVHWYSTARQWCHHESCQPAEPSAPVGFRVVGRSGPGVEQNDGDWIALARMVDGVTLPTSETTKPRRAWHAPSGPVTCRSTWDAGCYDILEPIAEPAAPPVAAKVSEQPATTPLSERLEFANHFRWAAEARALETALDAAKRDRDACAEDARAYQERLGLAVEGATKLRGDLDAAKAENEALRANRDEWKELAHKEKAGGLEAKRALETALGERSRWRDVAVERLSQLATRDARIAGLEASHREDVERAVREERGRVDGFLEWAVDDRSYDEFAEWMRSGDPAPKVGG